MLRIFSLIFLTFLLKCSAPDGPDSTTSNTAPMLQLLDSTRTGIAFTNTVRNTPDFNIFSYRNFYNGGGVGIGDLNNDGRADVFLSANQGPNKLFLNRGNWEFEDVSAASGIALADQWSTGVNLVDVNADGWLDIYVCNAGFKRGASQRNTLFLNQHDGTFREAAEEYGLDDDGYSTHAAFFDYDLDGDLDAYILNNSFIPVNTLNFSNQRERYAEDWNVKPFLRGGGDRLLRNDDGRYTDVTAHAGIYGSLIGFGLGVTVGDVNGDYYPDLYISNDFFERDYLYINQGNGTFKEEVEQYMRHLSLASMGADMGDINNDGYPELFTTEMLPETDYRRKTTVQFENLNNYQLKLQRGFYHQYMHNTLQLNNADGTFSEIAQYSGVEATDWSWGALLFDVDQDGWRDIFVSNGIYHNLTNQDFIDFFADDIVRKMALTGEKEEIERIVDKMPSEPLPNKLYRNKGDLTFEDMSAEWGLTEPSFSNGAAYGDLDGDGDLDLVVNNVNQPVFVYENQADKLTDNHRLSVRLVGDTSGNTFAIGATVTVYEGERRYASTVMPSRGFQSSVDYVQHIGIGSAKSVDSVGVVWPDRSMTVVDSIGSNKSLVVNYGSSGKQAVTGRVTTVAARPKTPGLLQEVIWPLAPHVEDDYLDLLNEGLVIRSLSQEGPLSAVGDINGDGLEDLYIGGARNQAGQLYFQQNGTLVRTQQAALDQVSQTEDSGIALFDADGDGDLDLYVGSAGNAARPNSPVLIDKLFFNDGAGNLTLRSGSLPQIGVNTSVIVPLDFDVDGDLDLFVGTRSLPGNYGVPVPSFLLENDGTGRFRDITRSVAPQLATLGMVTDAVLQTGPATGEGMLTVVSEWGSPRQFRYVKGNLTEIETNLNQYRGWWYAVEQADMDGDGDLDLILGNRGENFYFTADSSAPAKLYVADFDGNGTMEKILTQRIDGRDMPLAMKRDLTAQLASLRKDNLKHTDYAQRSIAELFTEDKLKDAYIYPANYFKSAIAFLEANGSYRLQALPQRAQLSSIAAIQVVDLDDDGANDLVVGGNFSGFLPQFSRLDASYGEVLINRGEGHFATLPATVSGMQITGDMKGLSIITLDGSTYLIATINDGRPRIYRLPSEIQ